ncbi:MAG: glycosyltransferase [Cyanobium sp.]
MLVLLGHYLPVEGRSMAHYRHLVASGLQQRGYRVQCLTAPVLLGRLAGPGSAAAKWLGYGDQLLIFPLLLFWRQRLWPPGTRVLVLDQALGPWVPWIRHRPHLIICHDLLALRASRGEFAEQAVGLSGRLYQRWIHWGFRRGRHFAAVSAASAADLARELPAAHPPITVLPNPLPEGYGPIQPEAARELLESLAPGLRRTPFLLHVGGYWYKNRQEVCEVFRVLRQHHPQLRLVLVGHLEVPTQAVLQADPHLRQAVVSLAGVEPAQLQALYSTAEALLFPSWWEGFGWPVLEALACGCPVITTDRDPMREVGGAAALYVPPCPGEATARRDWIAATATTVQTVLQRSPRERALWRQRALEQAARFGVSAWLDQLERSLAATVPL